MPSDDFPTVFPIVGSGLRGYWARRNICPECGGELDTGWECNACGFDAMLDARPELVATGQRAAAR